ncbi:hypothetical protein FOA43_001732 [Brettanomyces nanus]|uniref:Pseudouridine synthase I TruA alpha/beta domain-containing protein n=1 Tax=Eeniella nana TaxID=13502 RepID=A0A875S5C5_EENNA|nr:uncharacterized protein FOA43_001732 [Brettanomyces nanus]QPG74404.1 hypothetical protein FOA43_001732 [Brettanomyces nanus]
MTDYSGWSRESLIKRIHELERDHPEDIRKRKRREQRDIDFSKYRTRLIGLKFAYLGWDYQGLAIQGLPTELPTVEEKIVEALQQVRLVKSCDTSEFEFSRCGRTDKGVSAMNQVISLKVRSNLTEEELADPANDAKELDYIKMLNHVLPPDIRFHAICLRPPVGFDARFSCKWRQYKYIFNGEALDIDKMKHAAQFFMGQHDFRNFCKIDGSKQLVNFTREVFNVSIHELDDEPGYYVLNLTGSAFLWHQVRCMMAVLFTIGQGLESWEMVPRLMDIKVFPGRPAYKLAHDIPLILYDCGYDEKTVEWTSGPTRKYVSHTGLNGVVNDYKIKAVVTEYLEKVVKKSIPEKMDKVIVKLGDGMGQVMRRFIPYDEKQKLEIPDVANARWRARKKRHAEQMEVEPESFHKRKRETVSELDADGILGTDD